jgi:glyoxylase-like metal-dependent hydrolase (beta-lactamase superfamily II)
MNGPNVRAFFHEPTNSVSYLVWDPASRRGAIIDGVLDFDARSGRTATQSAEAIVAASRAEGVFKEIYNLPDLPTDGHPFDKLVADGETLPLGELQIQVLHTPGHTPACVSYLIGDAVFVGDTLFMPDYGTARADFPGGDARTLYRSIQKLLALPDATRVFVCHDYKAPGRDCFVWETTVGEQCAKNVHLKDMSEEAFVAMREARDKTLSAPVLLLPSIQVNIRAGELPPAEGNGVRYLKLPLDAL